MTARENRDGLGLFWARSSRLAQVLLLAGAAVLYAFWGRAAALGLLFGGIVSILRFWWRYVALRRGAPARAFVQRRLLAYALTGAALAAAFWLDHLLEPWATVAGLFAMNASVLATELLWYGAPGSRERTTSRSAGEN
ncbi:MAG: ATP synthase subunit I [Candidatus Brocadiia bacterium]